MKNLICCTLDVNISIESNAAKKSFFIRKVINIKYFQPIQLSMLIKLLLLWLVQLSPLASPSKNSFNPIESKSSLVFLFINLDRTESKSFSNNYCKNNSAERKSIGGEDFEKEDFEDLKQYKQY